MKNNYLLKSLLIGIAILTLSLSANAVTRTATTTGNWTTDGTWDCNCQPAAGDDIVVADGKTLIVDVDKTCISITLIAPSGGFNTQVNIASGVTLTVNGNVTLNGDGGGGSTTFLFFNGAAIANITGNITLNATAGSTARINMFSGASVLNLGGNIIQNPAGTLTHSGTASIINYNGSGAQTLNIGTDMLYNRITLNNSGSGVTLGNAVTDANVTGSITLQSGTFNNGGFAMATTDADSLLLASGTTFLLSGTSGWPTGFEDSLTAGCTVEYIGGNQTVSQPSTSRPAIQALQNFIVSGGSTKTLGANINVNGALTIVGTTTLDADVANNFNINIAGNWTNNQTFNARAATVFFDGATTVGGSATTTFNEITIINTFTLTADPGTMNVGGNWINNGSFDDNGGTVDFNGASIISGSALNTFNNLTISGTLTGPASNAINVFGNWNNSGTYAPNGGTVDFLGGSAKAITNTGGETFNNLFITGSGTLTLNDNVTVSNFLRLGGGDVVTGTDTLTLGTSVSNEGTLFYIAGSILGRFQRWVNSTSTDFLFPVGTSGNLNTATINFSTLTGGTITAEFTATDPGNNGLPIEDAAGDTVYDAFNDGFWDLAAGNGLVATTYNLDLDASGFIEHTIHADTTRLIKRGMSIDPWIFNGTHNTGVPPLVKRTGLSGLSQFGCGNICPTPAPVITGSDSVCTGSQETYTIAATTSAITWVVNGGTINSGQGTNTLIVDWNGAPGGLGGPGRNIKVIETNYCGIVGKLVKFNVNVHTYPVSPIVGDATPYVNTTDVYAVPRDTGYIYTWSLANGLGTLVDACCDSAVTVNWGATPGADVVQVTATAGACATEAGSFPVTLSATYISTTTGPWNDVNTWVGPPSTPPTAADSVSIVVGHVVTVTTGSDVGATVSLNATASGNARIVINTASTLTLGGDVTLVGAGTSGFAAITIDGNGTLTIGGDLNFNESVSAGGASVNVTGAGTVNLGGNLNLITLGTYTSSSTSTLVMNGSLAQTLGIGSAIVLNHVTFDNSGPGVTLGGAITDANVTGNIIVQSGIFDNGGFAMDESSNDNLQVDNGATFRVSTATYPSGFNDILGATSTVEYNLNGAQTVDGTMSYGHLSMIASAPSTKTLGANVIVLGNLTISANSTLDASTFNINLAGNWANSGTFTPGSGTVDFTGSAPKSVTNAAGETFNNLTTSGSGLITLLNNLRVNNTLTMTSANFSTGGSALQLGTSTPTEGTLAHTSGTVIGKFERRILVGSTGVNFIFPVGTVSNLNSATINFSTLGAGGTVTAEFFGTDPGNNGLPIEDAALDSVFDAFNDGFWDLAVGNGLVATTYNLDLDGTGFAEYNIHVDSTHLMKRTSAVSPWIFDGTHLAPVPPTAKRTGMSGLGQFGLGNICVAPVSVISGPTTVCTGDQDVYSCPTLTSTYFWTVIGGTISSGQGTRTLTVDWNTPGTPDGRVKVVETGQCGAVGDTVTVNVVVNAFPTSSITGDANPIISTSRTYTVRNNAGYSYQWILGFFPLGSIAGDCCDTTISVAWGGTAGIDTVFVIVTSGSCPKDTSALNIVLGGSFTSNGDGFWDVAGTWVGPPSNPPGSGDSVIIAAGHTVTVRTIADSCKTVTLNTVAFTNSDIIINDLSALSVGTDVNLNGSTNGFARITANGNGILNVVGNINMNEPSNANGAQVVMNGTSTLNLGGNMVINTFGTYTSSATHTLNLNGTGAQTLNAGPAFTFGHVTCDNSGSGITLGAKVTTMGNVTITSGTLNTGGFTLNCGGNFSNSGTFIQGSGTDTLGMTGSSAQTIGGSGLNTFTNLRIFNSSGGVSLTQGIDITSTGTLTLNSGILSVGAQTLTLRSDGSGTGRIGEVTGTGDISGNFTIERLISSTVEWRILASPVGGSTATVGSWNAQIPMACIGGSAHTSSHYTTVYTYDETVGGTNDNGYSAPDVPGPAGVNLSDVLPSGTGVRGYFMYVGTCLPPCASTSITTSLTGSLIKGTQSITCTQTPSAGDADDGWSLIGNPFPSAFSWDAAASTGGVTGIAYLYDPAGGGGFKELNRALPADDDIVPSMQGFFVHADGSAGAVVVEEADKIDGGSTFYKVGQNPPGFKLTLDGIGITDKTEFYFYPGASESYDAQIEALNLYSWNYLAHNISSITSDGMDITQNFLPEFTQEFDIPIMINWTWPGAPTSYTISIDGLSSIPGSVCVVLEDTLTNIFTDLRTTPSYTFTMTPDTVLSPRFILHVGMELGKQTTDITCNGANDGMVVATAQGTGPWSYPWTNSNGDTIQTTNTVNSADSITGLGPDTYMVYVTGGGLCASVMDSVIITEPTLLASSIAQDQNPSCFGSSDGSIDLTVSGGTQPYTYSWSNGATTEDLNGIIAGTYNVGITDANNCTQSATSTLTEPIEVTAGFTVSTDTTYLTSGATVQFYNSSINATSYIWDFGDGDSATSFDVWHDYLAVGTYTVVLNALDANGCSSTSNQVIVVQDSPPVAIEEIKAFEDMVNIVQQDGNVYIDFNFIEATSIQISVYNIIGQEVINRNEVNIKVERIQINLTNEKMGIYFIKVESKNNSLTEKVIY